MSVALRSRGAGGLATCAAALMFSIGSVLAQQDLVYNGTFEAG